MKKELYEETNPESNLESTNIRDIFIYRITSIDLGVRYTKY